MYGFALCCISNNSGVDERQRERVCVCVSPTAVPSGGISQLFLFTLRLVVPFSPRYGELGQSRVKISASVEDGDFSPGASL